MPPKMKYFNVNWENGMNIGKAHFLQQENAFTDKLNDVGAIFLNSKNYGLVPIATNSDSSVNVVIKADNQKFLKVKIFSCRAICRGGARLEILEEHQLPELNVDLSQFIENAEKGEATDFFVLLSVDPFNRQVFGDLNAEEDPPRYPYTIPGYKVSVISEKTLTKEGFHPQSFFI